MDMVPHPKSEINARIDRLQRQMEEMTGAILFQLVDMCYFSGTAQEGLVYIPKDSDPIVMIRKSLERAEQESPLDVIALGSLKTIKADLGITSGAVIGLELDVLPYNNYSRVQRVLDDAKIVYDWVAGRNCLHIQKSQSNTFYVHEGTLPRCKYCG